jgi:hypothetical protein
MEQATEAIIITKEEAIKIKSMLHRVHGSYFDDKSLVWNIYNFISCSSWNHRWGRKYAYDDTIEKMQMKQLNEVWGRNKNLLSHLMKVKDDLKEAKRENNKLKQLLNNK